MDSDQQSVIELLKQNKNILLLGQAGTGKSKLITEIKNYINKDTNNTKYKYIYITSTTGISALNIGGVTLHSFLGIGVGEDTKENLYKKVIKRRDHKKLKCNNILIIIDEVSMLSIELFEKIDYILKMIRGDKRPFGGIQILLSGDFLQLEPIKAKTIYKSELMEHFTTVILTKNYRQIDDNRFQTLLTNLRINKLSDDDLEILNQKQSDITCINNPNSIRLFTTNKDVNNYNDKYMLENTNKSYNYTAIYSGSDKNCIYDIEKQFKSKNIDILVLKKDLKVMLTRNIDISLGLVNGSLGIIEDFVGGLPKVNFFNGIRMIIPICSWEINLNGKQVAKATQIPLVISYASTIHKCQGMTLNSAVVDLKNVFANHMIYVALSRVKNLDGLKLVNFNQKKIKINKETLEFYNKE